MLGCLTGTVVLCSNSYEVMNPLGGGSPLGVDFKFARILVVVLYIFLEPTSLVLFLMKQKLMCFDFRQ